MGLRRDERGQAIQVGVALLLGILVVTITVYQVQIVPSQNAEVEFNHNREARSDLVDLRNSIVNAGTQGESDSIAVTLGTEYPPRAIFVNPPPASGRLATETLGNVSFDNVDVLDSYTGAGSASELVNGNHTTARIAYRPGYAELDGAGATFVEHGLAYNRFENNASDPLSAQRVVRGNTLTLVVLRGDLSEQGVSTLSVDPVTVSGPTDPIAITNQSTGPIDLYLPTDTPAVWNETLGTVDNASVATWNESEGRIRVELTRPEYQLRMAYVGVGTGVNETERYDVRATDDTGGGGGGAYTVDWTDPESSNDDATLSSCGEDECTWDVAASTGSTLDLNASLQPPFEGIGLEFAVDDSSVASVGSAGPVTTGSNGSATTTLIAGDDGPVDVLASGNGGSDVITIHVQNVVEDLVYNGDANAREPGYGTDGTPAMVSFNVSNQYDGAITITDLTYNSTSANPTPDITESDFEAHEVWIDTDGDGTDEGSHDGDIEEGDTVSIDGTPSLTSGAVAEVQLSHFESPQGGGSPQDMVGEDAAITLHYTDPDGDSQRTTVQMTDIEG